MENRDELLTEISELKAQIKELIKENKSMKLTLIRVIEDLQESNTNQRRMLANMRFLG
jgi:regulator of replication initiation timing